MRIVPIFQKAANEFVRDNHDHHKPVVGSIFQISVKHEEDLIGVAICGRPVGHKIDYKKVIEVNRLCVDRDPTKKEITKNACSKLYATCARIAKEMGYESIITYTLEREPGTSLKAAGWVNEGRAGGKSWNSSSSRIRTNKVNGLFGEELKSPEEFKTRWRKKLNHPF